MNYKYLIIVLFLIPKLLFGFEFSNLLDFYTPIKFDENLAISIEHHSQGRNIASIDEIPKNYLKNVMFWRDVYSYFDSTNILIHSKADLSNIFMVVNLERLYKSEPNSIIAEIKKNKIMNQKIVQIKNEISNCYTKKKCIYNLDYSINKEVIFKNLRTQTGQLDILEKGINRYQDYQNTIEDIIKNTNSNPDWLAIPFLESSFNSLAISKVGATGAWQIMTYIGKKLMPINQYVDTRKNPILSAYAGLKILKQNRIITKNEDISIIAYNSGLKNFFEIKNKTKKEIISTDEYLSISKEDNNYFDFASENFFLEYLAMKDFLKKNDMINKYKFRNISSTKGKNIFYPYVSKCNTRPSKVIENLLKHDNLSKKFNNHFRKKFYNKILPPGQIYLSSVELPKKYYKKMVIKRLDDMAPIKWKSDQINCSII